MNDTLTDLAEAMSKALEYYATGDNDAALALSRYSNYMLNKSRLGDAVETCPACIRLKLSKLCRDMGLDPDKLLLREPKREYGDQFLKPILTALLNAQEYMPPDMEDGQGGKEQLAIALELVRNQIEGGKS